MPIALLVLDERASVEEMVTSYQLVNRIMREKYKENGLTVLANDDAIRGKELEFSARSNLRFIPDWERSLMYRNIIREALKQKEIYVMKQHNMDWMTIEAKENDYVILDSQRNTNVKPR